MARKTTLGRAEEIATVLGPGTSLSGTLRFEDSLMIRGTFKGDIEAKGSLYIDENAVVDGGRV
ncbi:MAG TPA: polymer-forming cytoskeletal protein, partial [Spirochaetales bacterium]|nr:polymer-forming cytoskeletal protein [Spirochaetales bacterium]